MIPTQLYKYIPHTKSSKYNYYLISQIDNIPGSKPNTTRNNIVKKNGKKTFTHNMFEESKVYVGRNNKFKYRNNGNTYNKKYTKVYEFDNPIISYMDMNKKYN